jgi:hypothetical protein
MAKSRTKRSSKRNVKSKSRKGGWGGWVRTTHVGDAWNGANGGNHFALSKLGVPSGKPIPVPAFWGPDMSNANKLEPRLAPKALSAGGGSNKRPHIHTRRSNRRSKRGGFVFGGFPQDLKIGWDNLKIGAQNVYRGFMGTNQLNSASPWNQSLHTNTTPPVQHPDIMAIRAAAQARVAKIH